MTPQQSTASSSTSENDKCPYQTPKTNSNWWGVGSWFSSPSSNNSKSSSSELQQQKQEIPASIEEYNNHPSIERIDKNQTHDLNTQRTVSSITRLIEEEEKTASTTTSSSKDEKKNQCPSCDKEATSKKTTNNTPAHQPEKSKKWVYPSEQQFYNAMIKKGHNPSSEDVPTILKIHNAVNEKTWKEVLNLEKSLHPYEDDNKSLSPQLVRFMGRPKDLSPKALFNTYFLWYNPPFDRHDWFIIRGGNGNTSRPRRYVIDFYKGNIDNGMYLDVRPAVDDLEGLQDRIRMFGRSYFPEIFAGQKKDGDDASK